MMFYVENYSPRLVPYLTFKPPNHVACFTNWELMASLLRRVSPSCQEQFPHHQQYLTYEGSSVTAPISVPEEPFFFVDSHFHLDLILQRLRLGTFCHLSETIAPSDNHGFYYGVANYVFPKHWKNWLRQLGFCRTVYASFGIHPHVAAKGVTQDCMDDWTLF